MGLRFVKYQANGNDFILVDQRRRDWFPTRAEIARLCHRRTGIGADGLILLTSAPGFDFGMTNYNSDGGECTMCGNGGRALLRFAKDLGLERETYHFLAIDGEHLGRIDSDEVSIRMSRVEGIRETPVGKTLDTGSPHLVRPVSDLLSFDVVQEGRKLRNTPLFLPNGINVNFYEEQQGMIFLRTYERGVEDETLSCGTGAIATAIVVAQKMGPPADDSQTIPIHCTGGTLTISFIRVPDGSVDQIWLSGNVKRVFEGAL